MDSLPAEPQGKPKNTGVGGLSFLQRIFPIQELNWGLLHCRWTLYQLSYQGRVRSNIYGTTSGQADPVTTSTANSQVGTTISSRQGFPFATFNYVTCSISKKDITLVFPWHWLATVLREHLLCTQLEDAYLAHLTLMNQSRVLMSTRWGLGCRDSSWTTGAAFSFSIITSHFYKCCDYILEKCNTVLSEGNSPICIFPRDFLCDSINLLTLFKVTELPRVLSVQ